MADLGLGMKIADWTCPRAILGRVSMLKNIESLPIVVVASILLSGCSEQSASWECEDGVGQATDFLEKVGCSADYQTLASLPLDSSIPGARSAKVVVDRNDGNHAYFQNSNLYPTHYEFASQFLSGGEFPVVPTLADFNTTEYTSSSRRFVLGAITYYEGPGVYTYELSPYDNADVSMITDAYQSIVDLAFFGKELYFHPTSDAMEQVAEGLDDGVKTISTAELFEGIDFQALNAGISFGQIRFVTAAQLEDDALSYRDIAVLDAVPNDISVVMGIITAEFQTPLSHVNVLSRNRGTPNMGLRNAYENEELRALEGSWVRFEVDGFGYTIEEVTKEEADVWWEENRPTAVQVPGMNLDITDLRDIETVIDLEAEELVDAVKTATRAFGGKASHYSALTRIDDLPVPKAFSIPLYYYRQFMEQNGFDATVAAMIAADDFQNDPAIRKVRLEELRDLMTAAPVDADFEAAVMAKLAADYPGTRMRFRSSTNAEDLDGFTGAGLYTSKSGDPSDPDAPVMDAIREVWASIWNHRAYEERSYRSIEHSAVGMAMLVHRSFPDEEVNGVALTNNPFDLSGTDPAFYINVQYGESSVVQPDVGVTTDQIIYYFDRPGQPSVFVAHSNLIAEGTTVLTSAQLYELGEALSAIRSYFTEAYGGTDWWAMDVEFKFDGEPGEEPALFIKQARPYGQLTN